jgi:16S rRNA (adenine1518-N6/adenine1519-N6)-dimethyltransferase
VNAPASPGRPLRPLKSLGQHFLVDRGIARRIAAEAGVREGDRVLEVGPGRGILTEALLEAGARVTAVELDKGLFAALTERLGDRPGLTLQAGDALRFDPAALGGPYKVVANLPYQVTTPLLFHLMGARPAPEVLVVMVQREVADRVLAAPGTKAYGVLTLGVAARARAELCFTLPPGAFRPPPKVRSGVLRIRPHAEPPVPPEALEGFMAVVRAALGQRRKTLRNALAALKAPPARIEAALEAAGIDPGARGETLDLAAFRRLQEALEGDGTGPG